MMDNEKELEEGFSEFRCFVECLYPRLFIEDILKKHYKGLSLKQIYINRRGHVDDFFKILNILEEVKCK